MVPNPVQLAELAIERFCFGPCFAVRSRHAKFFRLVREVSWEDPRSARRFKLELSVVPWCRGGFHSRKTSERSYVEPLQVDRGRFPGLGSGRTRVFLARGYLIIASGARRNASGSSAAAKRAASAAVMVRAYTWEFFQPLIAMREVAPVSVVSSHRQNS